jgi:hypothetical protein
VKFKLQSKAVTKQSAYQKYILSCIHISFKINVLHTNNLSHPTGPPALHPLVGAPYNLQTSDLGKTNEIKSVTNNSL